MAYTDINGEDRLVQATFARHLSEKLGWDSVYAWNHETFGPQGTLGRADTREVVLTRDLRSALIRLNPTLPASAIAEALGVLTRNDLSRSLIQQNEDSYRHVRDGVPVSYRDERGDVRSTHAKVIDFHNGTTNGAPNNRFLAVRELKLTGIRAPGYNRRADLICFVNGLPLVFIELKAVYKNIRAGFDGNLRDYLEDSVVAHAFRHNAFLVVSNGDRAKYGSITSEWGHFMEWKRLSEADKGSVDAEVLLNGMLAHDRLLDIVENFILFDASKPGATRKVIARNHQVLGVNQAVESVRHLEELKREIPVEKRLTYRVIALPEREVSDSEVVLAEAGPQATVELVEASHPDLGRLGVFWHTQGSGKSYSIAFFTEKVRRTISAKFTFVIMTDRNDLDDQIYRTFVGSGLASEKTPRASTGEALRALLNENHRYVFSLIHKFNQPVDPRHPYTTRDDIIVISDEAHRTQAGKLARNMRLALPNAAFIGFTGTPLFQHDNLTRRLFGSYVSRYDFKRSEEDGSTVKLVYENRGEKLGLARLDINDRIAAAIEAAEFEPEQEAHLEKLLGKDYEVITADDRLDKIAADFVEHCTTRWESGKSMLVCIDKITCARMYQRILPLWKAKRDTVLAAANREPNPDNRAKLLAQARWIEETILEIIISEAQGEVAAFRKWDFDIIPHRVRMKQGFEVGDRRVDVESAFKDPNHPFRVAIVCAMWLTGFDVESLSTLYIDKPMKAHTLMQAIARANRVYPGKDFGLIVDYNGVLKSLRRALAQYALGDGGDGAADVIAPLEERVTALATALDQTEAFLRSLGFDPARIIGATAFERTAAFADAVDKIYTSDESRRRFEIMAREVFIRFKALVMERTVFPFAERHDNLEAIYKKLDERRDYSDVTALLKELHQIVNDAIRAQAPSPDDDVVKQIDISKIDMPKLRAEFAGVKRKATAIRDLRLMVEERLERMLRANPQRMDYYRRYQEIVAEYNRDKDRVTLEETFAKLVALVEGLDEEQQRAAEEGLSEDELALFDLLKKDRLTQVERERLKVASRELLASLQTLIAPLQRWTDKEQTQAEVEVFIIDRLIRELGTPPYTEAEKLEAAQRVYQHVWQQSVSGAFAAHAA